MRLKLGQVADWIHAEGDIATGVEATGYSIDSRTIGAGDLFFAVMGERVDGHDYVEGAFANGAVGAVVSMRWLAPAGMDETRLLRVPDEEEDCVLTSLQRLASRVRVVWGGRVIGVTGSAGKTTTKDAVATVLRAKFRVLKSMGNFNNGYGLPLQLLRLEEEHEVAVIEMGMNHAGEIRALAEIARPDWAVVSNVAAVHLEHFPEGIAGIAAAKYELVEALPEDGVAFLNADDAWVKDFGRGMGERAVFYGMDAGAVRGVGVTEIGLEGVVFTVEAGGERASVQIGLMGRHNVMNALAAIAVGLRSGMGLGECVDAVGTLTAGEKRGEVIAWRGATLINDCYNSNPHALDAMVDALLAVQGERHVVIAGEMLELGGDGAGLHFACGRRMAERGVGVVVGVRGLAERLVEGAREGGAEGLFFKSPEEAGGWMEEHVAARDAVLLKGSRGVRLERALRVVSGW